MVEKLKEYDVGLVADFFGETLENIESSDGEFFKVEDVEPILNSLQQLQAKIAALADELELINRDDFYSGKHVTIAGRMRQLF